MSATDKAVDFSKQINLSSLQDQSILVIGGANGIGEYFVEALIDTGAFITIFDIDATAGNAVARKHAAGRSDRIQFIQGNVCSWDEQVHAFDSAASFAPSKSLDIVLVVAGILGASIRPWLEQPTDSSGKLIKPEPRGLEVNLIAPWWSTHLALYHFRRTFQNSGVKSKQIVYVGSIASFISTNALMEYGSSKYGVRGLWRSIRNCKDLLGKGVEGIKLRTNLIAPWFVETNLTVNYTPGLIENGVPITGKSDLIDVLLRIVSDDEVSGRAIVAAPQGKSFDTCDEIEGFDGSRELKRQFDAGTFGMSHAQVGEIGAQ